MIIFSLNIARVLVNAAEYAVYKGYTIEEGKTRGTTSYLIVIDVVNVSWTTSERKLLLACSSRRCLSKGASTCEQLTV